ncbi:MAG: hypothetical protein H8E66_12440 [Planctomycetes bacterium]|nr:hypothetical protein [Planctomycetota bacterium]
MDSDAQFEPTTVTCPRCDEHLKEISRLQDELAQLRQTTWPKPGIKWSTLAAVGTFLFATVPNLPWVVLDLWGGPTGEAEWLFYILWGMAIGALWAQWSLLGIFCMLSDQSLLQRVLLFVAMGSVFAGMTFISSVIVDTSDRDTAYLGYASPFLTIVIVIPVFVARSLCRWTIMRRASKAAARPMSLSSYILMMTVLGITLATIKFFPWQEIAGDMTDAIPWLLVFGGPLFGVGCLHSWTLPKLLGLPDTRSVRWPQWLLLCAIILVSTLSSIASFAAYVAGAFEPSIGLDQVFRLFPLPISLLGSALIVIAAGYYWLCILDYELRTA